VTPHYQHTQAGWVVGASIVGVLVLILALGPSGAGSAVLWPIAAIMAVVLLIFTALTVEVDREAIRLRFGIGLVRRTIPLARVKSWRAVSNPWYVGWGIRRGPGYWMWNVSGLEAVELVYEDGRRFRIGTDEPEALSKAIERGAGRPPADPAGLLIGVPFYLEMIPPRATVTSRGFEIESVFYGQEYLWSDVTELRLEPRLPRVLVRTNGFAAAGILRGHFRVEGLGVGKLFVDVGKPPFILVLLREGFVIVNVETAEKTRALYDALVRARQLEPGPIADQQ